MQHAQIGAATIRANPKRYLSVAVFEEDFHIINMQSGCTGTRINLHLDPLHAQIGKGGPLLPSDDGNLIV